MKKIISFIICVLMLVSVMSVNVFADSTSEAVVNGTEYATLAEAVSNANDGDAVELLKDVTVSVTQGADYAIKLEKDIIIDGKNFEVTCDDAKRTFAVYSNVTFKDITIVNNVAAGRCIDTRVGGITLNLEKVVFETTKGGGQPLTIGGNAETKENRIAVNITDSTITSKEGGYSIITFNPVDMTIKNSAVTGYAALYMKGDDNSVGSVGSVVDVINSTLHSVNSYSSEGNNFGTIVFEDNDIIVEVDENSKITADSTGSSQQGLISLQNKDADETKGDVTGIEITVADGAVLQANATGEGATAVIIRGNMLAKDAEGNYTEKGNMIIVPAEYVDELGADGEGYALLNNGDGSYTVMLTVEEMENLLGHKHTMTKIEAAPATCIDYGNIEYYLCEKCFLPFEDETGNIMLSNISLGDELAEHDYKDGKCTVCGEADSNAEGDNPKDVPAVEDIPKTGDNNCVLWIALAVASAIAVVIVASSKRKFNA